MFNILNIPVVFGCGYFLEWTRDLWSAAQEKLLPHKGDLSQNPYWSESVVWDDTIPSGKYQVPEGTASEMVRSVEPYREKYRLSKGEIYGRAVKIYRLMRGKPKVDGFSSYMGRKLARSDCGFNEETLKQLEDNVDRVTSQILDKKSGGNGA